jgi:hypothetical protein
MMRRLLPLGMLLGAILAAGCNRGNAPAAASASSPVATSTVVVTATVKAATAAQKAVLPEGVLYEDDFSNPDSGWPVVDVDNYRFGYHPPDFYHVEVKSPHDTLTVFRGMNNGDASVETTALVDHTTTDTGDYHYGLALRRAGGRYYAFTVSPRKKAWQIAKHSPTGVKVLAEGSVDTLQGFAPKGVTPDKKDDLRVDAVGSNFTFFINGQNVARVSDGEYASGDVGFIVETVDESLVHVHYDSLVISKPKQSADVLFEDDFVNPEGGWPVADFNNYRFGYHPPDFYHVEVKAPHDQLTVFRGMNFGDVSVETTALVDHTTTASGGYRYGLALRRSGDQYYAFTVSPRSKSWQIAKHAPQGVTVLAEGDVATLQGFAPPGVTPDKKDDLRVDAIGSNFTFFINGAAVTHVSDADYATGDVGFVVETLDESLVHVHYDSLVIRSAQPTPIADLTPTPVATPTMTPTAISTVTPLTVTALPSDTQVLIDTVLSDVVERANNAEVDAALSGDEKGIDRWWNGTARDRISASIKGIRDRFVQVTEVNWARTGEWIKVQSHSDTEATYTTSETWTFVGTTDQKCADGSALRRRYVETYPSQRYTLQLKDGKYQIVAWQLGRSLTGDITTLCQ